MCLTNYIVFNSKQVSHAFYVLACIVLLTACGGSTQLGESSPPDTSTATFTVSGQVTGLNEQEDIQIVLSSGSVSETISVAENGNFSFTQPIENDNEFNISIQEQPEHQICSVSPGSGQIASENITDIIIDCENRTYSIGGEITDLNNGEELQLSLLANGEQELLTINTNGAYTFSNTLENASSYSVSISQQPDNQICAITSNSGTVATEAVTNILVQCSDITDSLSGSISLAVNIFADSDLNDPFAPYADNSSFSSAQDIGNLSTIQGFLTKKATGFVGDRYASNNDINDYYRVSLQKDQVVQMQVIDYQSFNVDNLYSGDLDLGLYNINQEQIALSQSVNEFEVITIPEDGVYFLHAYAYSGTSKYIIKIISGSNISSAQSYTLQNIDFVPGQAIVKYENTSNSGSSFTTKSSRKKTPAQIEAAKLLASTKRSHHKHSRAALASFDMKQSAPPSSTLRSKTQTSPNKKTKHWEKFETLRLIKRLRSNPEVSSAEPNFIRRASRVPNDEYYNWQWHYPSMNLPQAWDYTTGAPNEGNVIVAVVDTGVVLNHPDLRNKLVPGFDFIQDIDSAADGDGIDNNPDDPGDSIIARQSSWHGTHVAGTIAAESNNGVGVAGVSWGAQLMPLRVLGRDGGTSYDVLQAVRFAAGLENDSGTVPSQRADIINLSLGGPGGSITEAAEYQAIYDSGVIIVAAAGNDNSSNLSFPASYAGVISVSALDAADNKAPYSNFGSRVDIAAPGGNSAADLEGDGEGDGVLSTYIDDSSGSRQPAYSFQQGTSMATPHVAGMLALMKAIYPDLSPQDVDNMLANGDLTRDGGDPGRDDIYGHGIADALKAVQAALELSNGGALPELPPSIVSTPVTANISSGSASTITLENVGGGSPTLVNINEDASWLTVSAAAVDAQGLGEYLLTVDRTGLVNGIYIEPVDFNFDDNISVRVQVTMMVGNAVSDSQISQLYPILYDPHANNGEGETILLNEAPIISEFENGQANYRFSNIPYGSYYIFIGTDIDNDSVICQGGEGCGAYPSLNQPKLIELNSDSMEGFDMVIDIIAGLSNIELANFDGLSDNKVLLKRHKLSATNNQKQKELSN